jgi:hypothetical protein
MKTARTVSSNENNPTSFEFCPLSFLLQTLTKRGELQILLTLERLTLFLQTRQDKSLLTHIQGRIGRGMYSHCFLTW